MMNTHGGDIYAYKNKYGAYPLDFSANTNPKGLPQNVLSGIRKMGDELCAYPDPNCTELTKVLSQKLGVRGGNILFGNGAADIIFAIAYGLKPKSALIIAPTFSEYEIALKNIGCKITYHHLMEEESFDVQSDILPAICGHDIVFVCSPNNPTGRIVKKELLLEIAQKCGEENAIFVLDECFLPFYEGWESQTMASHLNIHKNMIILNAFTKIYAMAGVRLGYCLCGLGETLQKMRGAMQGWSVSTVAQMCGVLAIDNDDYVAETVEQTKIQRELLQRSLVKMGLKVFESDANYILFRSDDTNLREKMMEKGVLIRSCSNYVGLDGHFYRVAVKAPGDNKTLLKRLEETING